VLVALVALALAPLAPAQAADPKPDLDAAASAILIDARDGSVLLAKRPEAERSMASTTKLMTALLTLEHTKPDQVFTASGYRAAPIESKISLRSGERMRVSDLFEGLMLESANDAAVTLAEGISGSRPAFVRDMNERAAQLALRHTRYSNPIGLDEGDNHTSAHDLAELARRLMRDPRFARVVGRPSAVLESGSRRRVVNNRNDLVGRYPYVKGVKTGHTRKAGYVLVGAASNAAGARVVSVVMGTPSEAARNATSLALLQYGLKQFQRRKVLDADTPVASAKVRYRDQRTKLVPRTDLLVLARRGEKVRTRVDAPDELGETPAGRRVGTIAVLREGKVIDRVPLVTAADVPGTGPLRRLVDALGGVVPFFLILVLVSVIVVVAARQRSRRRERERAERRRARKRARARAEGQIE
jgi:D-alanyl-D-alanine carboxypeptidase (penicillin-binding protein 5/6)